MTDTRSELLLAQLEALCETAQPLPAVTLLSNAAALLMDAVADLNWAGIYLSDGRTLYLGPFQGKPACTVIAYGKGVCGTAAAENKTQRVENVHLFAGHIACDSASNSELVIPLHSETGEVIGVLDLDSTHIGRFSPEDQQLLEQFCRVLEHYLPRQSMSPLLVRR